MLKGGHRQPNLLHDINWGTLDHAYHAPNYCHVTTIMCVHVCNTQSLTDKLNIIGGGYVS